MKNNKGKIFFVIRNFSYGAAASNRLLAYAKSASKQGYDVKIVSLLSNNTKDYKQDEEINIYGLLACKIKCKPIAYLLSFFTALFFLIFSINKRDKILLYSSQDYLPLFVLFRRNQTWFELTEFPELFPPNIYPFSVYKWLWKKVKGMIVISSNLKEYFNDKGVQNVSIINMIVDSERFDKLPQETDKEKYIAYCGNICDDSKDGVSDLIYSFIQYHSVYSNRKLLIIGPVRSEIQKNNYIKILKGSGIEDYVTFTGLVSPNEMPALLSNSEMLVLARPDNLQAKYGFPTKLGEYLLSGRPVVLTDVGNIKDFLKDGHSAFIAAAGNPKSIAEKMIEVSSNEENATTVGMNGKLVAMQHFSSDRETNKLLKIMFEDN